ncbi:HAD family hydrolase [Acinetobacter sp. WCHAc060025]|uniref:HAD family hydrolase n=1 Tax=Acinetobacter sp. WCHAc060025 TaxID=2518625 RepID=UPI0010239965|nr:HAD hydrolase-like protein [Acinetobacter sp. WCHAc060025]RZG76959.1 HAD family hydrolase [Acinetobacter sp. WCHAc060025]
MKIIFDLDGTLICSKKRLYKLFCDLVKSKELGFDEYWNLKFMGNTNQDILKNRFNYSLVEITEFIDHWMINIESDTYLKMDSLIPGVADFLDKISQNNELYICTARQSISQVTEQLADLGILVFFRNVYVTEQKRTKIQLLIDSGLDLSENDLFIGDTGHDILTGKEFGMTTIAVLSGFMSEAKLELYTPDYIVNDITVLEI